MPVPMAAEYTCQRRWRLCTHASADGGGVFVFVFMTLVPCFARFIDLFAPRLHLAPTWSVSHLLHCDERIVFICTR